MSSTTSIKENDTWKQVSSERYLWLQDNEIGAVDKDSHLQSLRLLGEGFGGEIGAAVAFEIKGELFIPIHDLSGHVRACVNSHGEIAEKLSYTAFGLESRTGQITPWTFSSKRQDEATGFVYFGRRYYDPKTATWLTQDPLGHTAGPNLYAYVKNNPLTCIDLYGLEDTPNGDRGFWGQVWDSICDSFSIPSDATVSLSDSDLNVPSPPSPREFIETLTELCTNPETAENAALGALVATVEHVADTVEGLAMLTEGDPDYQPCASQAVGTLAEKALSIDPNNPTYQAFRNTVCLGLTIGPLIVGNVSSLRGVSGAQGRISSYALKQMKNPKNLAHPGFSASPARINHILAGSVSCSGKYSGGHLFPGLPGKTVFPKSWNEEKIMTTITKIANDPTVPKELTKGTNPERYVMIAEREDILIKVIVQPSGKEIITAYPFLQK
jgi:RHS repeat-associated protein